MVIITFRNICLKGNWEFVVFFAVLFFPFYISLLSLVYTTTKSSMLLTLFQSIKEIVFLLTVLGFVAFQKDLVRYPFRFTRLDVLFISFYLIAVLFLIFPIGEAQLINKALYFKNVILMGLFYFFGRNTRFDSDKTQQLLHLILVVGLLAFCLNLVEFAMDTHFQQFTGYAKFNEEINDVIPKGNFGLTWTFETQAVTKRFASFFADPLELAISALLMFSTALIMYLTTKRESAFPYLIMIGISLGLLMFSSSRSSLIALVVLLLYIAFVFRQYKLLLLVSVLVAIFSVYLVYFASEDLQYFVIDTITFQNTSSLGHLVEWMAALDSMISNPMGIGLATSGNVSSVDDSIRVGGENQFLVFGVQMGWIGMFVYIFILGGAIIVTYRAFSELKKVNEARVAFIATAVKFAMILPLFTSNAEKFFFVSLLSWWMVGYTVNALHRQRLSFCTHEIEPAYRTGRHDASDARRDDYCGEIPCDL